MSDSTATERLESKKLSFIEKCKSCHYGNPTSGKCSALPSDRASYCRLKNHVFYLRRQT